MSHHPCPARRRNPGGGRPSVRPFAREHVRGAFDIGIDLGEQHVARLELAGEFLNGLGEPVAPILQCVFQPGILHSGEETKSGKGGQRD